MLVVLLCYTYSLLGDASVPTWVEKRASLLSLVPYLAVWAFFYWNFRCVLCSAFTCLAVKNLFLSGNHLSLCFWKLAYCFCRRYTPFGNILVFSFTYENKYLFERKQCFDVSEDSYQLHWMKPNAFGKRLGFMENWNATIALKVHENGKTPLKYHANLKCHWNSNWVKHLVTFSINGVS